LDAKLGIIFLSSKLFIGKERFNLMFVPSNSATRQEQEHIASRHSHYR